MVSVIVPIYRVEQYLRECLDSIQRQTYRDIEVILVNDGSPDHSKDICEEYCASDPRFLLVSKENQGLGFARNTGLEYVHGEYVLFVDSDDYIREDSIEVLLSTTNQQGADTVIGSFIRVNDQKQEIPYYGYSQQYALYIGEAVKREMLPKMFGSQPEGGDSLRMSACGVLYCMSLIREHSLKFCSEREYTSEDLFFNLDYYQHAQGVCVLPDNLYYYRYNHDSLSTRYRTNWYEMKQKIYEESVRRLIIADIYEETKLRLMKYYFLGIRACIHQEIPERAHKSQEECKKRIAEICNDSYFNEICREYPLKRLGFKQRLFISLVRHKCTLLLMRLAQHGFMD